MIDLHGQLDPVRCMGCEQTVGHNALQDEFERLNPDCLGVEAASFSIRMGGKSSFGNDREVVSGIDVRT